MAWYDYIKVRGMRTTRPPAIAPDVYEVFQGGGSSAGAVTTSGGDLPDEFVIWLQSLEKLDVQKWIEDLYAAAAENYDDDPDQLPVPRDPTIPVIDIITLIDLFLQNPIGALVYFVVRFGLRLVIGWLKRKIIGGEQTGQQLRKIAKALEALDAIQDLRQEEINETLEELKDYFKDKDIVQAIKDLQFNNMELALPGGGRIHLTGKWIQK